MPSKKLMLYSLAGAAVGLVLGINITIMWLEVEAGKAYEQLAESCERYADYYHAEEESIRSDQAFARLQERSRVIRRVSRADELDIPYGILIVDLGRGYHELLSEVEEELPVELHHLDQAYWEAAQHTGDVLERYRQTLEHTRADQASDEE